MTDITIKLSILAAIWLAAIIITSRVTIRSAHGSIGLPMAFLFSTTFFNIGAFTYLVPGYSHLREGGNLYLQAYDFTESTVFLGVLATLVAIVGFTIGCWLLSPRRHRTAIVTMPQLIVSMSFRQRVVFALSVFGILGFLLNGADLPIPMLQALAQVARNAAIVVVCLGAALVVLADRSSNYVLWVVLGAAIPATYTIVWGFTSFGFIVFTCFAGFWLAVLASNRIGPIRLGLGGAALTYTLLSLFVAWMSFREDLRDVLWSRSAGLYDRLDVIFNALGKVVWLRPSDFESLDWLNIRLNQYVFVGKAIEWHDLFPDLRLHGETIALAALAWVPRFVWSGKPVMGGNAMVSEHTGLYFSKSATFGVGPVFEFYVNFGWGGVFIGFIVLGLVIRFIDRSASLALRKARLLDFARWFTVGLAFIAPLTNLFFLINTALISFLVLTALKVMLGTQLGHRDSYLLLTRGSRL